MNEGLLARQLSNRSEKPVRTRKSMDDKSVIEEPFLSKETSLLIVN
ncbi:MAG: hypothetical protein HXS52_02710 [Theionarchaea archaeon]|nr:hypothetical protein [Theionarchaea archaeon]